MMLVKCLRLVANDPTVSFASGGLTIHDFDFAVTLLPGAGRTRPTQMRLCTTEPISHRNTVSPQAHNHCRSMPTTGGNSLKYRMGCSLLFISMKDLWVISPGKILNFFQSHMIFTAAKAVSDVQIFQIQHYSRSF